MNGGARIRIGALQQHLVIERHLRKRARQAGTHERCEPPYASDDATPDLPTVSVWLSSQAMVH